MENNAIVIILLVIAMFFAVKFLCGREGFTWTGGVRDKNFKLGNEQQEVYWPLPAGEYKPIPEIPDGKKTEYVDVQYNHDFYKPWYPWYTGYPVTYSGYNYWDAYPYYIYPDASPVLLESDLTYRSDSRKKKCQRVCLDKNIEEPEGTFLESVNNCSSTCAAVDPDF